MSGETTNTNQKALRAGVGYTVGNILIKGIGFVSLPIFARLMSVSDYGAYNTFASYVSVLCIIIGFALHVSIKNALYDFPGKLHEYCSSVSLLTLLNTALLLIVGLIFAKPMGVLLGLETPLIAFLIVESAATTLIMFYNHLLALDYQYKEYLWLSFGYSLGGIGLSVVLILFAWTEKTYYGRVVGATVAALGIALYVLFRMYRRAKPKINGEYWKYGMKISLPIIPHGLSQVVLAQFDRIMIHRIIGSVQAGFYSFAYNIGTIYQVVANSLDTVWTTWFFERMSGKQYSEIKKVANYYCVLLATGAMALMLVSPEVLLIMGGAQYTPSITCAAPIVLAMFYSAIFNFPASIEYYYKKTNIIAIGTCVAAVLNIVLNAIFIPKFGYVAAAYTTVVCYIAYYFVHVALSKKIHGSVIYSMKIHLLCQGSVIACAALTLFVIDLLAVRMVLLLLLLGGFGFIFYKKLPEMKRLMKDRSEHEEEQSSAE